jgi:hypothetical protein
MIWQKHPGQIDHLLFELLPNGRPENFARLFLSPKSQADETRPLDAVALPPD